MRDPERIKTILSLLKQIWSYGPDLRLGQIITNATDGKDRNWEEEHLFFIEDDKMIKQLESFLVVIKQKEASEEVQVYQCANCGAGSACGYSCDCDFS